MNQDHFAIDNVIASFGNPLGRLNPRVISLRLGDTTESSMTVSTLVNFTNPTQYSATIPFVDLLILYNDTTVGHIAAQNLSIVAGNNSHVPIDFLWCPLDSSGDHGVEAGRALFSSYISGGCLQIKIWIVVEIHIYIQVSTHPLQPKPTETRFQASRISEKHFRFSTSLSQYPRYQHQAVLRTKAKIANRTSFKAQRYPPIPLETLELGESN